MNFREFATKNVLRNIKAYFAYFLSSTISAALLFSLIMFMFHPELNTSEFVSYIQSALKISQIIAYVFLCFFVFYSVSVFLKSRYKEFGTLFILGISKKQIKQMIFIENIIISTVASITGVLIGLLFSKIFLVATSKLLGIEGLGFYIPVKAMSITIVGFMVLGVAISFCTSFVIKENKVLKLLKGVMAPKEEPKTSWILGILSVALIVIGYYKSVTSTMETIAYNIIPVTVIVIIGTYFLFSHCSVYSMKVLKGNRNFYMNKTKFIWISNLFYKIKDNTRMFFLISITSAIAFSSIGGVYSFWRGKEAEINDNFPQALFYQYDNEDSIHKERCDSMENLLKDDKVEYTKVIGNAKGFYQPSGKMGINIIDESTYKELTKALDIKNLDFNKGEVLIGSPSLDGKNGVEIENKILEVKGTVEKRVLPALYDNLYIVKDDFYKEIKSQSIIRQFIAFNVEDFKELKNYSNRLNLENIILSKSDIFEFHKISYGLMTFLSVFLGLIFFVTTGSFLYNKLYMETEEDKIKYTQLNKIGLTFKEIKKVSTIEIGVLFLLPYIVAVIHSLFALGALKSALGIDVTYSAVVVMGSFLVIQILYFLIIRGRYLREIKNSLIKS